MEQKFPQASSNAEKTHSLLMKMKL
ncbi:rCG44602 [Rattus norvegicus]|uniref:RCG44602 n=1 Tax=Rattus norvegicus TaxID=10116 RepID=A6I4I3_RAT|nr:rCG44602 [Rattus norvegicus]